MNNARNKLNFIILNNKIIPKDPETNDFIHSLQNGYILTLYGESKRSLKFHKTYFKLLNFIYGIMPSDFKKIIPEKFFYVYIKDECKMYNELVIETNSVDKKYKIYDSISFDKLTQKQFEKVIKIQLISIYEKIIKKWFSEKDSKDIIETIENKFFHFLNKLN